MNAVDLGSFDNSWYRPGRSSWIQGAWFLIGLPLLRCSIISSSAFRVLLLRAFGARIGCRGRDQARSASGVHPWQFCAGDQCWIGEDCWIDNLAPVEFGNNVCVSQGAYLCTGNHRRDRRSVSGCTLLRCATVAGRARGRSFAPEWSWVKGPLPLQAAL